MPIHREGHKFLIIFLILAIVLALLFNVILALPFVLLVLLNVGLLLLGMLLFWFFRIPVRPFGTESDTVYAPVDGKIVVVEKVMEEEHFKENRIQVSIFMSPFNPHVNFSPMSGTICYFKYHPGDYLLAFHPKSSSLNERTSIGIEGDKGSLLMKQIAGAVARRIVWYCKVGDQVSAGSEIGFIKFGSRIDLLLPESASIMIKVGQRVTAGKDVIAKMQ